MADTVHSPFPIPDLIQSLEGLYQVLLNLTVKAKEKEEDLEKQIAFEETRKAIVEEADQILEEARNALSEEHWTSDLTPDIDLFEQKKEGLTLLIQKVLSMDQQRTASFQAEKEAIRQSLHQAAVGKHAAIAYQKTQIE